MDNLEHRVNILERDVSKINLLVDRLDHAIEKLTDISNNVSQLLSNQALKIEYQENITDDQKEKFSEFENRIKSIEKKFYLVSGGLTAFLLILQYLFYIENTGIGHIFHLN